MNLNRRVMLLGALLLGAAGSAPAQEVEIATSPAPDLKVVLSWPEDLAAARFNVYRKNAAADAWPSAPLNPQPLAVMTDCTALQATVPASSSEWELLERALSPDPENPTFDPCDVHTIVPSTARGQRLQQLARGRWRIAVIVGQGYVDTAVTAGTAYHYEVRGVAANGAESGAIGPALQVVAGVPGPVPAPAAVVARGGDRQVLITWGPSADAAGFVVERAASAGGPYARVNPSTFTARFQHDLEGALLAGGAFVNGYVDAQSFDATGMPLTGPFNDTVYWYRVASVDLLDQAGPPSAPGVDARPLDHTPPRIPDQVSASAQEPSSSIEIRWRRVGVDRAGHPDEEVTGYRVRRYEGANDPSAPSVQVGPFVPDPGAGSSLLTLGRIDMDPGLRSEFGPKTWWYRIVAEDAAGNVSAASAAVSAHLLDLTAPAPPGYVEAEGFEDRIQVRWKTNTEPDMDGYLIYRSLCHFGEWIPCPERERDDDKKPRDDVQPVETCSGPFGLVGYLSHVDAVTIAAQRADGLAVFDDLTVPPGSPVCYAYLIKAIDTSQNKSGAWPMPDLTREVVVCERLRDRTPPEGAVVTALRARDGGIRVEWVGAPVQDIGAYHVYRSEKKSGPWTWVGGATVALPPDVPTQLTLPLKPVSTGCDTIPLVTIEEMSAGTVLDKSAVPKVIYWYKVVGVDQVGNETPLDEVVAVSTFTFSEDRSSAPGVTVTPEVTDPCGLRISWTPAFDPALHAGFVVFRSRMSGGTYLQLGDIVRANERLDSAILRDRDYWYRVAALDATGRMSELSAPVKGRLDP